MNNPKELLERNFPTADQDARRASRPSLYAGDDSSYELAFTDNDFLLHTDRPVTADDFKLSVIDLHRAQTRAQISRRWRDTDLAAPYFSAPDIGLTTRDKLRFLRGYFPQTLRQVLAEEAALLRWLEGKAQKLYARKQRYGDAL